MSESFWERKISRETFLKGSAKAGVGVLVTSSPLIRSHFADALVGVAHAANMGDEGEISPQNDSIDIFQTGPREITIDGNLYVFSVNKPGVISLIEKLAKDREESDLPERARRYLMIHGLEISNSPEIELYGAGAFYADSDDKPPVILFSERRLINFFHYKQNRTKSPYGLNTFPHEFEHLIDHIKNPNDFAERLKMRDGAIAALSLSGLAGGIIAGLLSIRYISNYTPGRILASFLGASTGTITARVGTLVLNADGDPHRDNPIYSNIDKRLQDDPELLDLTLNIFDFQKVV